MVEVNENIVEWMSFVKEETYELIFSNQDFDLDLSNVSYNEIDSKARFENILSKIFNSPKNLRSIAAFSRLRLVLHTYRYSDDLFLVAIGGSDRFQVVDHNKITLLLHNIVTASAIMDGSSEFDELIERMSLGWDKPQSGMN